MNMVGRIGGLIRGPLFATPGGPRHSARRYRAARLSPAGGMLLLKMQPSNILNIYKALAIDKPLPPYRPPEGRRHTTPLKVSAGFRESCHIYGQPERALRLLLIRLVPALKC